VFNVRREAQVDLFKFIAAGSRLHAGRRNHAAKRGAGVIEQFNLDARARIRAQAADPSRRDVYRFSRLEGEPGASRVVQELAGMQTTNGHADALPDHLSVLRIRIDADPGPLPQRRIASRFNVDRYRRSSLLAHLAESRRDGNPPVRRGGLAARPQRATDGALDLQGTCRG
jgi:hypothetical protein